MTDVGKLISDLVLAGISAELVGRVVTALGEVTALEDQRSLNRERQRRYRERHVTLPNVSDVMSQTRVRVEDNPLKLVITGKKDISEAKASSIAGQKKSRRCPSDYEPSEAVRQVANGEGFHPGELERELAKFRDHQFRDVHTDWNAAFRNWLRRAAENRPKNGTDQKLRAKQENLDRAFRAAQTLSDERTILFDRGRS